MAEPIKVSSQKHPSFYVETITRELETNEFIELSGLGTAINTLCLLVNRVTERDNIADIIKIETTYEGKPKLLVKLTKRKAQEGAEAAGSA